MNIVKEGDVGWNSKEACTIEYCTGGDTLILKAAIKCRGGVSSKYFKHSYSLELDDKFSVAGLPRDDDWILNANYIDKTFMRHKISYDLFREMSPNNAASQCAYVNLLLNGKPMGLYVLMQEINAGMLDLDRKDPMAMLFKDPPVFYADKITSVQDSLNYYQQKYPKIQQCDKTSTIEEFKNFLFFSSDSAFAQNVSKWVDIDNVIDWHIVLLFSNNSDGIMKNFYLYKPDSHTPFRFAIWDYDHSYGRDGDNEPHHANQELNWQRCILLKRLYQIPATGYTQMLKDRWAYLRKHDIISVAHFKELMDENDKAISQAVINNFALWPVNEKWYFDANTYQQETALMLKFVEERIPMLDAYIEKL